MLTGTPPVPTPDAGSRTESRSLLPHYLAICYLALIVYASLHPFSGWRTTGLSPLIFIEAAWPRYWTAFDLAINVIAYFPLGFFLAQSINRRLGNHLASFVAFLLGAAVSLAMESLQTYLPSRVPSNVDLLCNSLGSGLGAALSLWCGRRLFRWTTRMQQQRLASIQYLEYGLILIGLWLLTQLSPETILFGAGDLRQLFNITPAVRYAAPAFFAMETGIIICNTIAIGLILNTIFSANNPFYRTLPWFFGVTLLTRMLATAILVGPQNALAWMTPGASLGLLIGGMILSLALLLPSPFRIALAGVSLMTATVLVNIAPFNPYSVAALAAWRQGHFLNFNGLTRLAASFWPFLALPYLLLLGRRS
jgi:VanZ family protein